MADYIYLLQTRLSKSQQAAVAAVRQVAKDHELTVFLVGGAIRDLISGAPVRDLDVAVQGNALKLKKDLEKVGAEISGESPSMQALHLRFGNGVRMEIGSTLTTSFPRPGRAVAKPATILEDLRRRDFTANAMALSLNEGSYGLLMDPLNGVADIENRELRLVSNYGFIEDPVRLVRAARFMARLGWGMDEKTEARYATAKEENYIAALQPAERGYEVEELFHEEDPLRVMRRLEEEGWLQHLAPALGVAKANAAELGRLRDLQMQLQEQGVAADAAAANFPLLTAKLSAKETLALRESFPRRGFVREIDALDTAAKAFAAQLSGKQASTPSQAYRLLTSSAPLVVLWTAFTTKNAALQAKFKSFATEWPQARQRIPYVLMQELRITPDLPQYDELLEKLSLSLMDGLLETPEAIRAFLDPYSPPAPPPPVSLRRPRVAKSTKKETRSPKARKKAEDEETSDTENISVPAETAAGSELPAAVPSAAELDQKAPVSIPGKFGKAASAVAVRGTVKVAAQAPRRSAPIEISTKSAVEHSAKATRNGTAPKTPAKRAPVVAASPRRAPVKGQKTSKKLAPKKKAVASSSSARQGSKTAISRKSAPGRKQQAAVKKRPAARLSARPAAKPVAKKATQSRRTPVRTGRAIKVTQGKKKPARSSSKTGNRK